MPPDETNGIEVLDNYNNTEEFEAYIAQLNEENDASDYELPASQEGLTWQHVDYPDGASIVRPHHLESPF